MSARLSILALAVLATGTTLLTACGQPSPENTSTSDEDRAVNNVRSGDELDSVNCGPVDLEAGVTHALTADPSPAGVVGCTEAFNVLDEYLTIPVQERSLEGNTLSDGWFCSTDDGEAISIGCVKGTGEDYDFAFHTEPANTEPGGEESGGGEPVDCGQVEPDEGSVHTLIADPSSAGIVGCTEAFNVLDEYLTIPAQERNLEGNTLSDDWSCSTDDGETTSIGCVKGTGEDYDFAFHTEPVAG